MSIQAISDLTGWDRKMIRRYMKAAGVVPEYGPRAAQPSKLDAFKLYLEERLRAGVWNARVLLRELCDRNFTGSYTILTDWLRPQRSAARVVSVRRCETPACPNAPSPLAPAWRPNLAELISHISPNSVMVPGPRPA